VKGVRRWRWLAGLAALAVAIAGILLLRAGGDPTGGSSRQGVGIREESYWRRNVSRTCSRSWQFPGARCGGDAVTTGALVGAWRRSRFRLMAPPTAVRWLRGLWW
jgi:hypothetical protein